MQDAPRIAASIRPLLITKTEDMPETQLRVFTPAPQINGASSAPVSAPTDIELLRATSEMVRATDEKIIKHCFGATTHE